MKKIIYTLLGLMLMISTVSAARYVDPLYSYVQYSSGGNYRVYAVNKTVGISGTTPITSFATILSGTDIGSRMDYGVPTGNFVFWSPSTTTENFWRYNKTDPKVSAQMAGLNRSFEGMMTIGQQLFVVNSTHITSLDIPDLTVNMSSAEDSCASVGNHPLTLYKGEYIIRSCGNSPKFGFEGYHISNLTRQYNASFTWSDGSQVEILRDIDADATSIYAIVQDTSDTSVYLISSDTDGNIQDYFNLTTIGYPYGYESGLRVVSGKIYVVGRHDSTEELYISEFDKALDLQFNDTIGGSGNNMVYKDMDSDHNGYLYIVMTGDGTTGGLYKFDYGTNTVEFQTTSNVLTAVSVSGYKGDFSVGQQISDITLINRLDGSVVDAGQVLCDLELDGVYQDSDITNSTGIIYFEDNLPGSYTYTCYFDISTTTKTIIGSGIKTENFYVNSDETLYVDWYTEEGQFGAYELQFFVSTYENIPVPGFNVRVYNSSDMLITLPGGSLLTNDDGFANLSVTKGSTVYYNASKQEYLTVESAKVVDKNPTRVDIQTQKTSGESECFVWGWVSDADGILGNSTVTIYKTYNNVTRPESNYLIGGKYNFSVDLGMEIELEYNSKNGNDYKIDSYTVYENEEYCLREANYTATQTTDYHVYVYEYIGGQRDYRSATIYIDNDTDLSKPYDWLSTSEYQTDNKGDPFYIVTLPIGADYNVTAWMRNYENGTEEISSIKNDPNIKYEIEISKILEGPDGVDNCFPTFIFKTTTLYDEDNPTDEIDFKYKLVNARNSLTVFQSKKIKVTDGSLKDNGVYNSESSIDCDTTHQLYLTSDYVELKSVERFTIPKNMRSMEVDVGLKTLPIQSLPEKIQSFGKEVADVSPYIFWLSVAAIIMFLVAGISNFARDVF